MDVRGGAKASGGFCAVDSSIDPHTLARELLERHVLSLGELWLYYWRNGGNAGEMELDAFIYGIEVLAPLDLALPASALDDARRDWGEL
ncbi:hypothetical protein D9M72_107920 [compost metagenome]